MNACCLFQCASADEAARSRDFEVVEDYGDTYCDSDGNAVHYLHSWDDGCRMLVRCRKCGALFLMQKSEFHSLKEDRYYIDYFAISSREEALVLNAAYDGFAMERSYKGARLWSVDDHWLWIKPEEKLSSR